MAIAQKFKYGPDTPDGTPALDRLACKFAAENLSRKHRVIIEVSDDFMSDYVEFRTRGIEKAAVFKIDLSFVASLTGGIDQLTGLLERGLHLDDKGGWDKGVLTKLLDLDKPEPTVTEATGAEHWAEEWLRKQ